VLKIKRERDTRLRLEKNILDKEHHVGIRFAIFMQGHQQSLLIIFRP
jgi:hypothetical protein